VQEGDRRLDVPVAVPAERVRIAVAVALAAPVEQQHAVAVAHQHPGLPLGALAARERDHRRVVPRGHVPPVELKPVVGLERDLLEVRSQLWLRHDRAADVGVPIGGNEREHDDDADDQTRDADQGPAQVAPRHPVVQAPGSPERHHAHREQHQAGGDGEQPGVVVARGADLAGEVPGLGRCAQSEHTEQECHHGTPPGTQPRVRDGRERQHGERHEATHEVIGHRRSRLRLEERVVDDVQGDQADRNHHGRLLAPAAGVCPATGGYRSGDHLTRTAGP
jgi:hypothetical protein